MRIQSLLSFCSAVGISLAQTTNSDPINNFCRRWYHQSQVKNGILYIDGGVEAFFDREPSNVSNPDLNYSNPITVDSNKYIISVNMSKSWDFGDGNNGIFEVALNKIEGKYVPVVQSGALFHGPPEDPHLYLYGGTPPNLSSVDWQESTTSQYSLWGFDTGDHTTAEYNVSLATLNGRTWGAFAEAPELGLAFFLDSFADTTPTTGTTSRKDLIIFNLRGNDAEPSIQATNISTVTVTDGSLGHRGGMVYISQIGYRGALILLGGSNAEGDSPQLADMNQVNVFDVDSAVRSGSLTSDVGWHTQTTKGHAPPPRIDFCLVVASAPDNSSFNIHMYGGRDPIKNEYFDDIWILSIPSFIWIKAYGGNFPRFGHTCHLVGNRQMVTVGGINDTNTTASCDQEWMGMGILDLTSMNWIYNFDSEKDPYQVSTLISAIVGGGPDGGATMLLPNGGWSSTPVAKLFTGTENQTAPYTTLNTERAPSSPTGASNKSNVGPIIGGTIGGVAFVVIVVLAFVFWWRSRRRRLRERQPVSQPKDDTPELDGASMPKASTTPTADIPPAELGGTTYQKPLILSELEGAPPNELEGSPTSELHGRQMPAELES